jgi:hypothetical protein
MPVRMYIGMVTHLCMYIPSWVYVHHLTQRSNTVAGGVGACYGCVPVTLTGDIETGLWPVVQGG